MRTELAVPHVDRREHLVELEAGRLLLGAHCGLGRRHRLARVRVRVRVRVGARARARVRVRVRVRGQGQG